MLVQSYFKTRYLCTICKTAVSQCNYSKQAFQEKFVPLRSDLNHRSSTFQENHEQMLQLVDELKTKTSQISLGGTEHARQRHTSKGKMLPRDRIQALVDPGTAFLEFSQLAGYKLYGEEDVPAGGIITGIGR